MAIKITANIPNIEDKELRNFLIEQQRQINFALEELNKKAEANNNGE